MQRWSGWACNMSDDAEASAPGDRQSDPQQEGGDHRATPVSKPEDLTVARLACPVDSNASSVPPNTTKTPMLEKGGEQYESPLPVLFAQGSRDSEADWPHV